MTQLITTPNLPDPDAVYQQLIDAHAQLSDEQSIALNARLILTLVNHLGDSDLLAQALAVARGSLAAETRSDS
jgi:hypothetical protein